MKGRVQTLEMKQAVEDVRNGMSMAQAARLNGVSAEGIRLAMNRGPDLYRVPVVCPKCQHAHVYLMAHVSDVYGFKVVSSEIDKKSPLYQRLKA